MSYCVDHGIPHSVFLGRIQKVNEPYWTDEDQDKVMMFLAWKAELCPQCGTKNSDWVDDKGRLLEEPLYEAVSFKCEGCAQVEQLRDHVPDKAKGVYCFAQAYNPDNPSELEKRRNEHVNNKIEKFKESPWA